MNTSPIRPGDLVRVDDGLVWYGLVLAKNAGGLCVAFLTGDRSPRGVKARDVTGHWRKSKATP